MAYQATLAEHWLVMGVRTDSSPVDTWLSKMEAAIENIVSFAAIGNLVVDQLIERQVTAVVIVKAAFTEKPKWTTVMAKNMRQVVSQAVETQVDAPKQEERKFNLRLTGFEPKNDEIEKQLVQRFNIELLQGQMRLHVNVVVAMQQ
jgi:hypothetical protein